MIPAAEPNHKRIRTSTFDNSALILENALTLIGRLTNPKEQSISRIINDLPQIWTLLGRVVGSELGNDCFQFRFQTEEDLQRVLSNRPYHSNRWMLILQRWEPIISASFPSQISFWIKLKGLPLHFWHERMMEDIAKALGLLEDSDISSTSVRIRVLLNGLEPLAKDTIIEFSEGEEALVTLEYEELEKVCSSCNSLIHSSRDCKISPVGPYSASKNNDLRNGEDMVVNRSSNKSANSLNRSRSPDKSHLREEKKQIPSFH